MYLVSGVQPPRRGTGGNGGIPSQSFNCSDRPIMLTAGNDAQYRRLCEVLGKPEWIDDPRFVNNNQRVANRFLICDMIDEVFRTRPAAEWLKLLDEADVPAGPINDFPQVFADPQIKARHLEVKVKHPLREDLHILASPMKFSETPIEEYRAPPMLGANTDEVLKDLLGMDDKALATLRAEKII
jgi:crotonobetainyl-CoA:carnitine CoA-transferase CaiB-like acyl-CoA transferase